MTDLAFPQSYSFVRFHVQKQFSVQVKTWTNGTK